MDGCGHPCPCIYECYRWQYGKLACLSRQTSETFELLFAGDKPAQPFHSTLPTRTVQPRCGLSTHGSPSNYIGFDAEFRKCACLVPQRPLRLCGKQKRASIKWICAYTHASPYTKNSGAAWSFAQENSLARSWLQHPGRRIHDYLWQRENAEPGFHQRRLASRCRK